MYQSIMTKKNYASEDWVVLDAVIKLRIMNYIKNFEY